MNPVTCVNLEAPIGSDMGLPLLCIVNMTSTSSIPEETVFCGVRALQHNRSHYLCVASDKLEVFVHDTDDKDRLL